VALPQLYGTKKRYFLDHLFRDFPTRNRISPERNVTSTNKKCYCQYTTCTLKVDLLYVTFDPETAEICLLIVTHPYAATIKSFDVSSL